MLRVTKLYRGITKAHECVCHRPELRDVLRKEAADNKHNLVIEDLTTGGVFEVLVPEEVDSVVQQIEEYAQRKAEQVANATRRLQSMLF